MNDNRLRELFDSWENGNLRDVADALVENNKLSDAIRFSHMLCATDRNTLIKMLDNRCK